MILTNKISKKKEEEEEDNNKYWDRILVENNVISTIALVHSFVYEIKV